LAWPPRISIKTSKRSHIISFDRALLSSVGFIILGLAAWNEQANHHGHHNYLLIFASSVGLIILGFAAWKN